MSDPRPAAKDPRRPVVTGPGEVWCRRLLRPLPLAEHERCSYCFGERDDIATGDPAKFCDFDAAKDPIHFGFPDGGGHVQD